MITLQELQKQSRATMFRSMIGVWLVFVFLGIDGVMIAQEWSKDSWASAVGITIICPIAMTIGVWMFLVEWRSYLKQEEFLNR